MTHHHRAATPTRSRGSLKPTRSALTGSGWLPPAANWTRRKKRKGSSTLTVARQQVLRRLDFQQYWPWRGISWPHLIANRVLNGTDAVRANLQDEQRRGSRRPADGAGRQHF